MLTVIFHQGFQFEQDASAPALAAIHVMRVSQWWFRMRILHLLGMDDLHASAIQPNLD